MEDVVSERGEVRQPTPEPVRPEDHPDWPRVQRWAAECAAGRCRYRSVTHEDRFTDGCPGYAGFAHLEEGRIVMRYRSCDRKLRWWRAEQERIRQRRATAKHPATPGSGWREEG